MQDLIHRRLELLQQLHQLHLQQSYRYNPAIAMEISNLNKAIGFIERRIAQSIPPR